MGAAGSVFKYPLVGLGLVAVLLRAMEEFAWRSHRLASPVHAWLGPACVCVPIGLYLLLLGLVLVARRAKSVPTRASSRKKPLP